MRGADSFVIKEKLRIPRKLSHRLLKTDYPFLIKVPEVLPLELIGKCAPPENGMRYVIQAEYRMRSEQIEIRRIRMRIIRKFLSLILEQTVITFDPCCISVICMYLLHYEFCHFLRPAVGNAKKDKYGKESESGTKEQDIPVFDNTCNNKCYGKHKKDEPQNAQSAVYSVDRFFSFL